MAARLFERNPKLEELYSSKNEKNFEEVFLSSQDVYVWNCITCGDEFKKRPELIYAGKTNCAVCVQKAKSRGRALSSAKKFGSIDSLSNEMKEEWVDKLPMDEVSINSKKKYEWNCSKCGKDYSKAPYNQTMIPGCIDCRRIKIDERKFAKMAKDRGSFLEHYPEIAAEWDYTKNEKDPSNYTKFSTKEIWWICPKCSNSYKAPISRRAYGGTACPACGKESRLENIVQEFLEEISVDFILNSYPIRDMADGLTAKSRKLQLDFYLPDYNLAFEVQDFASHSRVSDEEISRFFGNPMKGPVYHENKRLLTLDQLNCKLVDLWEDDIDAGRFKELILAELLEEGFVR